MPRWAVHLCLEAGMNVVLRSSSPPLAAGNHLKFNHALCAKRYLYASIRLLASFGHKYANASLQRSGNFWLADNFRKVGRTNFFFAFANQHEIHREFFPRRFECMECAKKGVFRTFLVHSAATDADLSQSFFVHDSTFERRRRPLRGIELFHVVHEIDADCGCCTAVQSAEDPRLP